MTVHQESKLTALFGLGLPLLIVLVYQMSNICYNHLFYIFDAHLPDESHRSIYYKRKTPLPSEQELYLLDMFMNNWSSESNVMIDDENPDGDFMLFSSYEDALNEDNAWEYCNYDADRIGFPRECGPYGRKWNQWNSYVKHGGHAHQHGFYVEKA